jgi:trehalose-6-phosphatase
VRHGWSDLVELKRASLRLHTRGMAAPLASAIEEECLAAWQAEAGEAPVRLERVEGGIELRARGRDKGRVALNLLESCPPGTIAVALGDDESDECAFEAVAGLGFGVRVGDPDVPSLAHGRLETPGDVPAFLQAWLKATGPVRVRDEHPMLPGYAPELRAALG